MTLTRISGVRLPGRPPSDLADVLIENGRISGISNHDTKTQTSNGKTEAAILGHGGLLAPSLCHPHVHLDKAFVLGHPKYRHLKVQKGTFDEAMELTSGAKKNFTHEDLLERGQRLIDESVSAGVTHIRAFVEVDEVVGLKCLEAGTELKRRAAHRCHIQLCVFAQLAIKPSSSAGDAIRTLMRDAMVSEHLVDVVGSAPYVEDNRDEELKNIKWMIDLALEHNKHLDFHLDYNVDPDSQPTIFDLLEMLDEAQWTTRTRKNIVLGHCTRLTFFKDEEWRHLREKIGSLPISFVGLPTSDLYMMQSVKDGQPALRTTLPVPKLIREYGLNAAIGMNNIGNAFTPQGCCDPLYLANLGVSTYQIATQEGAELLYECISSRAKAAIGLSSEESGNRLMTGNRADSVLFPQSSSGFEEDSINDHVYYYSGPSARQTFYAGA